ncbi:MAG: hypothetical protein JW724_08235 [Candidatus Altiarchaeota archaeon]|nr:hypothetical protein [Candidatus Altiarchaeota archaeon]
MKKIIFTLTLLAVCVLILPGCCGVLSERDEAPETEEPEDRPKVSRRVDFEGAFEMVNEEYEDLSLKISRKGPYYVLEWGIPASEPWLAYGMKVSDYLGAATGGEDGIVGVYAMDGERISGVWLGPEELIYDVSKGADELELSCKDFSGTYQMESPDPETGEVYTYTLRIKPSDKTYSATEEFDETGVEIEGSALAVDDVIIIGFPVGGSLVAKMFEMRGTKLEGKTFYSYFDDEAGREKVEVGSEEGTRK